MSRIKSISIAFLMPIICTVVYLILKRVNIFDINILNSIWNDELFYYKQIEAIINYGHPLGNWGFNESSSIYGNFAAWNPTVLAPISLFGKLFGLNRWTPVIFNLFVWGIAFVDLSTLIKKEEKKLVWLGFLFVSYNVSIRYIFSSMSESMITAFVVMLLCSIIKAERIKKTKYRILCCTMIVILSAMRGYYAAFLIILLTLCIMQRKYAEAICYSFFIGLSIIGFLIINHYFTAEYITPIFDVSVLFNPSKLFTNLIIGANQTFILIKSAFLLESSKGLFYVGYVFLGILQLIRVFKKKNPQQIMIFITWLVLLLSMWSLYNAQEGSRHLMPIAMAGLLVEMLLLRSKYVRLLIIGVLFILSWFSRDKEFSVLPLNNDYSNEVELSDVITTGASDWDNTIIWIYPDEFRGLYTLPCGFGVNCCTEDWVKENIDSLHSKYILVDKNSESYLLCYKRGYNEVVSNSNLAIYELR